MGRCGSAVVGEDGMGDDWVYCGDVQDYKEGREMW